MTALREAIEHTALGWVKPELDETLRQAKLELEAYVDDPADSSHMRFCASFLHQVQGTLRMVDRDFVDWSNLQRQHIYEEQDAASSLPKVHAAIARLERVNSQIRYEPVIADINAEAGEAYASELGKDAAFCRTDVSSAEDVERRNRLWERILSGERLLKDLK